MTFSAFMQPVGRFFEDPVYEPLRKRLALTFRILITITVLAFLSGKIADIGWSEVQASLPMHPGYYALFVVLYLMLPICDYVIYRRLWQLPFKGGFPALLRKRVFNLGVADYSGDAYYLLWARTNLGKTTRQAFSTIKDVNILSGLLSNLLTVGLLAVFFFNGHLNALMQTDPDVEVYIVAAAVLAGILVPLVIKFRHLILGLPVNEMTRVLTIHAGRLMSMTLLQALQWSLVLPDVPFSGWLMFLTAYMVMTRIPLLPNKDLMFAALGVGLAGYVNHAPTAAVAGLFLASGALQQVANVSIYIATAIKPARMHDAGQDKAAKIA